MKIEKEQINFTQLEEKLIKDTFKELEFYTVLETVSKKCLTQKGRELITSALPIKDNSEIIWLNKELNQVDEMLLLLTSDKDLPLENISDVRDILNKAKIDGAVLSADELLKINDAVRVARDVKNFLKMRTEKYPGLSDEIMIIFDNPSLQKNITKAIANNGEIKDEASKELRRIRVDIATKLNHLRNRMAKIAREFAEQDIMQEDFYTIREGRFVVPIKSGSKRQLNGIIHGISQTGATVYVEPAEIVSMNNEIALLKSFEQREIYNILKELTSQVAQNSKQLINTYDVLGHIDSLHAKAVYALKYGGIKPTIFNSIRNEKLEIRNCDNNQATQSQTDISNLSFLISNSYRSIIMQKVEHPILVQNLGKKNVIPLSIDFNIHQRGHLISGPNAGGKTVALKSVGLNIILALSGLFPIGEVKTCPVNVFSSIGDHQSIENNLSTFSSQITKLKQILDVADYNSLVLVDEICSGTDPREGAALASGILDTFIDLNLFFIVTTHQSSLKTFALTKTNEKLEIRNEENHINNTNQINHSSDNNTVGANCIRPNNHTDLYENIKNCMNSYRSTLKHTDLYENIQNLYENIQNCMNSYRSTLNHTDLYENIKNLYENNENFNENKADYSSNCHTALDAVSPVNIKETDLMINDKCLMINDNNNQATQSLTDINNSSLNINHSNRNSQLAVIKNGSFEFDTVGLKPTYNFLSGVPGNSYAFFLARNVGLSERVIKRSEKYLDSGQKQLEDSINALQKLLKENEDIIKEARAEKLKYEGLKKDYENRKKELISKKKTLLDDAKIEAKAILQQANALVENTIKELREEKKSIAEIKTAFAKQQKELETEVATIQIEKQKKQQVNSNIEAIQILKSDDTVGMLDSSQVGIVLEVDNNSRIALVEFNGIKFRLPFSQLYLREKPMVRKASTVSLNLNVKTRLDLHGFRVEDALKETTNFISQAILGNADYVTIIHGLGTGALQNAIHELLKHTTTVKSFRSGDIHEGGEGVTVVYLK